MGLINKLLKGGKVVAGDLERLVQREIHFYSSKPSAAILFLTYRCNSSCKTCTAWRRNQAEEKKKELDLEAWKSIADKLSEAGVRNVEIFGGNVLLRKDLLLHILEYLKWKNFTIHIPTNQIGMDDEVAEALVRYADYIYVSTDGVGDLQNNIRGQRGAADRVQNTIATLSRLRGDQETPRLICNTTVSKFNVMMLDQLADYAQSTKFDEIHYEYAGEFTREHVDRSCINGLKPTPYFLRQDESILVSPAEARMLKNSLLRIKKRLKGSRFTAVTVNIDTLSEHDLTAGTIPYKKCYMERIEATVDPSGNLVACPFFNNYAIGSLLDHSLSELWNNKQHRLFRQHQNAGVLELCKHCILGVQRNPGMIGSLKRIYHTRIREAFL